MHLSRIAEELATTPLLGEATRRFRQIGIGAAAGQRDRVRGETFQRGPGRRGEAGSGYTPLADLAAGTASKGPEWREWYGEIPYLLSSQESPPLSVLVVPLRVGGTILGAMAMTSPGTAFWSHRPRRGSTARRPGRAALRSCPPGGEHSPLRAGVEAVDVLIETTGRFPTRSGECRLPQVVFVPMRPLPFVVFALVAAPAGLASQDTTASPLDWWGEDSNRVAFVTAHGQPRQYAQLIMWAPTDSLDPRWLAAFGDTLDKGLTDLRALVGGPYGWQRIGNRPIVFFFSPGRFVSHATGRTPSSSSPNRIRRGEAPFLP